MAALSPARLIKKVPIARKVSKIDPLIRTALKYDPSLTGRMPVRSTPAQPMNPGMDIPPPRRQFNDPMEY